MEEKEVEIYEESNVWYRESEGNRQMKKENINRMGMHACVCVCVCVCVLPMQRAHGFPPHYVYLMLQSFHHLNTTQRYVRLK